MDLLNDVFMTDPYQSLEADLDDVSEVIRNNCVSSSTNPCFIDFRSADSAFESGNVFSENGREAFSPLLYGLQQSPTNYDSHISREIGSIVSQLRENDSNYNGFCGDFGGNPSMQSQISPNITYLNPQSFSRLPNCDRNMQYYRDSACLSPEKDINSLLRRQQFPAENASLVKAEKFLPQHAPNCEEKVMNTKEELMALLEKLTPDEVDKLRASREERNRQPPVIGVATKMTSDNSSKNGHSSRCSAKLSDIPRTISSPLNELQSPSSDNNATLNDSDMELDNSISGFSVPKTKRRTAHNLIEKKYRCSINDRIQQLKSLVAPSDSKLSKSAVLRLGIDHIIALRQKNDNLENEVSKLRKLLEETGIKVPRSSTLSCDTQITMPTSPTSNSSFSTSVLSSCQAMVSPESSPIPQVSASRPMVDKSRVTIVVFMFMFVICNPLSVFMGVFPANVTRNVIEEVIPGRTLQEFSEDSSFESHDPEGIWWQSPIVRPCFIWSVNIFIVIYFLTRLLIYGEPVADAKSSSWAHFLNMKANAYACIRRWNYAEAKKYLQECLKVLERPLPTANYDELISVIWQIIRHLLNSIWIGRWLSRFRRSAVKTVPVVCRSHAQTAIVYHQLNQLHLIGTYGEGEKLAGLNLALSAVNLAESAGCSKNGLSHALRADIYLNAAVQMKLSLPPFLGAVLSMYFMRRAKRHVRRADEGVKGKLMWLFHPLARRYLNNEAFVKENLWAKHNAFSPFVRCCSFVKPIERLMSAIKMEMLGLLVAEVNITSGIETSYFTEISRLLFTISSAPVMSSGTLSTVDSSSFDAEGDEVCKWWTHVFICALYWKNHDYGIAQEHYAGVRKCPKPLLAEPISLALGHAFCSRKLCIHDRHSRHFFSIVWNHAVHAMSGLQGAAFSAQCVRTLSIAQVISDKVRLLSLEWLLTSLFDVWHAQLDVSKPYWQQPPSSSIKCIYEEIYMQYRSLAREDQNCYNKIDVFELTLRVLNGSNPVNTWRNLSLSTCGRRLATSCRYISEQDGSDNYPIAILKKLHSQLNVFSFQSSNL